MMLSSKSWRLAVTELGGTAPLSEAHVEAGNWMTALALARKAIGESGAVPPGASCSVAPDGKVTIHDAVGRKTYVLAPSLGGPVARKSAFPPPSTSQPPARRKLPQTMAFEAADLAPRSPEPAPTAASGPAKKRPAQTVAFEAVDPRVAMRSPDPAPAPEPPKKQPARTLAFEAVDLSTRSVDPALEPKPAPEPAPAKKKPAHTMAYEAVDLGLCAPEPAPVPASEPEPAPVPASEPAPVPASEPAPAKKTLARTMAFEIVDLAMAPAAPSAEAPSAEASSAPDVVRAQTPAAPPDPAPGAPRRRRPAQTMAYDAAELGLAPPVEPAEREPAAPTVVHATSEPSAGVGAYGAAGAEVERHTIPDDLRAERPGWDLLHSRDEEPTKDLPLAYRERTYVVGAGTSLAVAEAILLARLEELQDELADRPKGKLVNMAAFDHSWAERPERPPLLSLQWKDWRGEPVISRPNAAAPLRAPSQPPSIIPAAAPAAPRADMPPSSPPPVESQPSTRSTPSPSRPPPRSARPVALGPSERPAETFIARAPSQRAPAASEPRSQPPPATPAASEPQAARVTGPVGTHPSAPPIDGPAPSQPAPAGRVSSQPPRAPSDASTGAAEPTRPEPAPALIVPPAREPATANAWASAPPPAADPAPPIAADAATRPATHRSSDDRLASAFEALQDLFFLTTPREGLDFVVQLLGDLVPCEAATACLYDINTDEFRLVALTGPGAEERRGEAVPRLQGLVGAAARAPGEPLLVEDVGHDERYDPGVDGRVGLDPENMAICAVARAGRLLGLLQLVNRVDAAQFSRADANLLTYVAEKLGEFLHALRMRPDERPSR